MADIEDNLEVQQAYNQVPVGDDSDQLKRFINLLVLGTLVIGLVTVCRPTISLWITLFLAHPASSLIIHFIVPSVVLLVFGVIGCYRQAFEVFNLGFCACALVVCINTLIIISITKEVFSQMMK